MLAAGRKRYRVGTMGDCIVHIGMHKTGTTSIQESLNGYANDCFYYASLGETANHSLAIYSLFIPDPSRHHMHRLAKRDGEGVRAYIRDVGVDFERSISAARGRTLLISGEDIGVMPPASINRLRDYLRARFSKVTIVGYVRPPGAFIASAFQQMLKAGNITSFDIDRLYRPYEKTFAKFDEAFGRENVLLRRFRPEDFPERCVVRDFCALIGTTAPRRIVRENESLSRQVVSLLYIHSVSRGKLGLDRLNGRESRRLAGLFGPDGGKFRFAPSLVRPIVEAQRPDIEWMEARLGSSLVEDFSETRPGDVSSEKDLLEPTSDTRKALLRLLGSAAPKGVRGETVEEIAQLVQTLRSGRPPRRRSFFRLPWRIQDKAAPKAWWPRSS